MIFVLQNLGPHMLQKCATFAPSAGSVSSWYASAVDASAQAGDGTQQDRRDDTPAPQPHNHQQCIICHAGHGALALPEQPGLELGVRLVAILDAPPTSSVRTPETHASLPPSRA